MPNDGLYSAFFGAVGSYNVISQTIATTAGDNYNISFALTTAAGPYSEAAGELGQQKQKFGTFNPPPRLGGPSSASTRWLPAPA